MHPKHDFEEIRSHNPTKGSMRYSSSVTNILLYIQVVRVPYTNRVVLHYYYFIVAHSGSSTGQKTWARHIISFFDLLPWKLVETYGGSRFISLSVEISIEVGGSRFTSMEVVGSFHGNAWTFPLLVEVEASIASIDCSFHEYSLVRAKLSWASKYPNIVPPTSEVLQTSSWFHKTSIRVHQFPLDLLPWKFPATSMESFIEFNLFYGSFHGSQ